jgi:hypothetical protein
MAVDRSRCPLILFYFILLRKLRIVQALRNYSILVSSICLQEATGISDWLWPHGHGRDPCLLAVSSGASNREQSGYYMAPAMADVSAQHLLMVESSTYYRHCSSRNDDDTIDSSSKEALAVFLLEQ